MRTPAQLKDSSINREGELLNNESNNIMADKMDYTKWDERKMKTTKYHDISSLEITDDKDDKKSELLDNYIGDPEKLLIKQERENTYINIPTDSTIPYIASIEFYFRDRIENLSLSSSLANSVHLILLIISKPTE